MIVSGVRWIGDGSGRKEGAGHVRNWNLSEKQPCEVNVGGLVGDGGAANKNKIN